MNENDNPYASPGAYSTGSINSGSGSGSGNGGSNGNSSHRASGPQGGAASADAVPTFVPSKPVPQDQPVKDVSTETFMHDVIEASKAGPVVVDFWAPWCGPCKQLGPVIEKVAGETRGVSLCKMDIEQFPEISQQMGIQSIPAVVAFVNGRPADAFMGAKGETEVRQFFEKLAKNVAPSPQEEDMAEALEQANALAADGDHGAAAELFGAIMAREPGNIDAYAGLGQCYVAVGEVDMAQMLIDKVPEEHREKGPLPALMKAIELARQASGLGELEELEQKVESDPKDHQARMDYALALNAEGKREQAAEQLVTIVRVDRTWNDDGARTQLLEFFEAWGNADPATVSGRRALSSVLFS